jgi:hypothetical protein
VIFADPALTAVTKPLLALTVATEALLLLQVPPASPVLLYVAVPPIQSGEVPLTVPAFTFGLTVTDCEAEAGPLQPVTV